MRCASGSCTTLRQNPHEEGAPRTIFFAGKGRAGLPMAKLIIQFIRTGALTADQVDHSSSWHSPYPHYEHEPETRAGVDLITSGHFNPDRRGVFDRQSMCCSRTAIDTCIWPILGATATAHRRPDQFYLQAADWDGTACPVAETARQWKRPPEFT
jgi:hypothetical protein